MHLGKPDDVTPKPDGKDNYTFTLPDARKYKLVIKFGGADVTGSNVTVIVGQRINLTCALVGDDAPPITSYSWTVSGRAISNYVLTVNSAVVFEDFSKTNSHAIFHWVDKGSKQVSCAVQVAGQPLKANASFEVIKPDVTLSASVVGEIRADNTHSSGVKALHFGGYYTNVGVMVPGIKFVSDITDPFTDAWMHGFDLQYVQVGASHSEKLSFSGTNYTADGSGVDNGVNPSDWKYGFQSSMGTWATSDSPALLNLKNTYTNAAASDSFKMYLMFQYDADSIYVPLQAVSWDWSAGAVITDVSANQWQLVSPHYPNPTPDSSPDLPQWNSHIQPVNWNPTPPP